MASKNITLIGVNYYPEDSAIGLYSTQMAKYLANESGHNVNVITGFPYYPQWEIAQEYADRPKWIKENQSGINIYRYKQYVPKDPTFFKRIWHLLSFTFGSLVNILKAKRPDVVICIIPFTSTALLGTLLKWRYRNTKLWIHIQDFEFDAAIDSGLLSGKTKWIFKLLLKTERFLLNRADTVSTISYAMMKVLEQKSKAPNYYFTNWLDVSAFDIQYEKHALVSESKYTILYSGNIGAKQDWDFFLRFVDALCDYKDIEVVLVGEGAKESFVKTELKSNQQVKSSKLVPFDELPVLLSSADLHVLFQKKEVVDTVMPSKILGMMGSGRPSIVTGHLDSEVKRVFESSEGGYYFDADKLEVIINKVLELKEDQNLSHQIGSKAKSYVNRNYNKVRILESFNEALLKL